MLIVITKTPRPSVFVAHIINNTVIDVKVSVSTLTLSTGPTDGFCVRQPQRWRLHLWTVPGWVQMECRQVGHSIIEGFTDLLPLGARKQSYNHTIDSL